MKRDNTSQGGKDPNQGEGDKLSARHYNRAAREFVADGKVDDAAREARLYVERDPAAAERAEQQAKHGPKRGPRVSVDELVAKGRSIVERVRPYLERASQKFRTRLSRK